MFSPCSLKQSRGTSPLGPLSPFLTCAHPSSNACRTSTSSPTSTASSSTRVGAKGRKILCGMPGTMSEIGEGSVSTLALSAKGF